MPTPKFGYFVADKRVPSVTTILGTLGWGTDNLITWANNLGLEGKKHTDVRDRAADIGTVAHQMIDDYLHNKVVNFPDIPADIVAEAQTAFGAYQSWERDHHVRVISSEFPLVSTTRMFGGTPDALVKIDNGERVLLDFKTSRYLFAKHVLQVAAYIDLIAECNGMTVDRAIILRVGKDGVFRALDVAGEDLAAGKAAFEQCRLLHSQKASLEKLARGARPPFGSEQSIALPTVTKEGRS